MLLKFVTIIKIAECSAASDECVSENKRKENNILNPENSSVTVSESNEKCTSKSNEDLKITEINSSSLNVTSESRVKLENDDNSSTNNLNNIQDTEVTTHNEDSAKKEVNDKPINSTNNTCKLNCTT